MPAADLRALAVLAALLLFPGLLVVRARWTAVPLLSAAFWISTGVWMSDGRTRFVVFVVAASAFLMALRLARIEWPRPGRDAAVVAAVGLAALLPLAGLDVAPGGEMSLHSLEARLYVWRDGFPRTYEPVLPIHRFGAHSPGLHVLAGDVGLVSNADPARATLIVSLAAHGLVALASYSLLLVWLERRAAVRGAVVATALVAFAPVVTGGRANAAVLASGLGVGAAAILRAHRSRPSAAAAGMMAGAAALCDPPLGLLGLAAGGGWRRGGIALAVAAGLALPFLVSHRPTSLVPWWRSGGGLSAACAETPDTADLDAMQWIREHTGVTDVVCHEAGTAAAWIPALTGRGVDKPCLPAAYREEMRARAASRPCTLTWQRRGDTVRLLGPDGRVAYDRRR